MGIFAGLFVILIGWVFEQNQQWFHGADTVGLVLVVVGIIAVVANLLVIFVFAAAAKKVRRRRKNSIDRNFINW